MTVTLGSNGDYSDSVVDSITCPDYYVFLPFCTIDTTTDFPCIDPYNYLVLQCSKRKLMIVDDVNYGIMLMCACVYTSTLNTNPILEVNMYI